MEINMKVVSPDTLEPKLSSVEQLVAVLKECWVEIKVHRNGLLYAVLHGVQSAPVEIASELPSWQIPIFFEVETESGRAVVNPCDTGRKLLAQLCSQVADMLASIALWRDRQDMKADEIHFVLRRTSKPQIQHLAAASLENPAILPILRDALRESEKEGTASDFLIPPDSLEHENLHDVREEP